MIKFRNIAALTVLSALLVGCSSGDQAANSSDSTNSGSDSAQAEVIQVGTGNTYIPFNYLDENNEMQGFDWEVLHEVDNRLEDYEFEYQNFSWEALFSALDSNKIQMAAHQIEKNPEREEKYLFADESYGDFSVYYVTMKDSEHNPQSMEDLEGLTVGGSPEDNSLQMIEKYNEENGNPIEIIYTENTPEVFFADLESGTVDVLLLTEFEVIELEASKGDVMKMSDEPVYETPVYFAYNKDLTEFKESVDEIIKEMKEDGTLDEMYQTHAIEGAEKVFSEEQ